jgi:hypothetical protein
LIQLLLKEHRTNRTILTFSEENLLEGTTSLN